MEEVADFFYDLPKDYGMAFDIVHYIVCLQGERADLGDDFDSVTRLNPLASWASSMIICFAGGLLAAPLCGEPILSPIVDDPMRLLIASGLWYFMFYCPKDAIYKASKRAKIPLYALKGLYYPKKILSGIKHAKHIFKHNLLAAAVIATVKGNGSGLIKPFARLARGQWSPDVFESVKPSLTTKYCFVSALVYLLFPWDITYVIIVGLLITMKVGPLFNLPVDPFAQLEHRVSPYLFGEHKGKKD
eukprot:maker-scaffold589_size129586-snap-gene-0.45 protein:Tk07351 transcript:maker-scaffold589_size129586-snap-gene-0.45-mRNA-1 annotation:"trimeric intracellular cation channel type b"